MVQRVSLHPKLRRRYIEPMECRRVATLPQGRDWLYEIKQDGYRAIGLIDGNSAMLYSSSGRTTVHNSATLLSRCRTCVREISFSMGRSLR
jgi:hypothetical protein